jgi:hypothetical protein
MQYLSLKPFWIYSSSIEINIAEYRVIIQASSR